MQNNKVSIRTERSTRRVDTGDARNAIDETARFAPVDELGSLLLKLRDAARGDSTGLIATIANTISGAMKVRAGL